MNLVNLLLRKVREIYPKAEIDPYLENKSSIIITRSVKFKYSIYLTYDFFNERINLNVETNFNYGNENGYLDIKKYNLKDLKSGLKTVTCLDLYDELFNQDLNLKDTDFDLLVNKILAEIYLNIYFKLGYDNLEKSFPDSLKKNIIHGLKNLPNVKNRKELEEKLLIHFL